MEFYILFASFEILLMVILYSLLSYLLFKMQIRIEEKIDLVAKDVKNLANELEQERLRSNFFNDAKSRLRDELHTRRNFKD